MPDLTLGEVSIIAFVVVMVVSAPWWPRTGEAIALRIGKSKKSE